MAEYIRASEPTVHIIAHNIFICKQVYVQIAIPGNTATYLVSTPN